MIFQMIFQKYPVRFQRCLGQLTGLQGSPVWIGELLQPQLLRAHHVEQCLSSQTPLPRHLLFCSSSKGKFCCLVASVQIKRASLRDWHSSGQDSTLSLPQVWLGSIPHQETKIGVSLPKKRPSLKLQKVTKHPIQQSEFIKPKTGPWKKYNIPILGVSSPLPSSLRQDWSASCPFFLIVKPVPREPSNTSNLLVSVNEVVSPPG